MSGERADKPLACERSEYLAELREGRCLGSSVFRVQSSKEFKTVLYSPQLKICEMSNLHNLCIIFNRIIPLFFPSWPSLISIALAKVIANVQHPLSYILLLNSEQTMAVAEAAFNDSILLF